MNSKTTIEQYEVKKIFLSKNINVINAIMKEMAEWLNENVGANSWQFGKLFMVRALSGLISVSYLFLLEEDAMAFKLRWL